MIPALLVWLSLLVTAVALAVLHRRQRTRTPGTACRRRRTAPHDIMNTSTGGPEMAPEQHHAHPALDDTNPDGHQSDHHSGHGGHGGGAHSAGKHAGHHTEAFRRRFWWCLLLTVPVVATSHMVMDWFGYELDFAGMEWVGPVLGSVIFFWGGWPFLEGGWREIKERQPGMMLLIAMAITVAYVASMATSLDAFDLDFWWELAALVTIMLLGHWQEMRALGQAQDALAALAALLPDEAERVGTDGTVESVAIEDLRPGDVVLVRSGARVPADGEIVEGSAELDESMITGESKPVAKDLGDRVVAGTVSTDSAIRVRVDAVGEETALAGIQRLVAEAQASQSRAQVLADRAAALLFYVATGAAAITAVVWVALGDPDEAVTRVVTVLVISCPHALGLAIPLTTSISSAMAARNGILVKDRLALEQSRTVDAFLFDKTGTLTKGQHTVVGVAGAGIDEDEVLRLAGGVESDSEHPLARAIVTAAQRPRRHRRRPRSSGRSPAAASKPPSTATTYAVGGPALLRERSLTEPAELTEWSRHWRDRGAVGPVPHPRRHHRRGRRPRRRGPARGPPRRHRAAGHGPAGRDDHRRRPPGRRGRRHRPRRRRGHGRGPPRGQGRQGRRAAGPGPQGGDGRRRRQRRPRARPRRCRHRHRRRHRRRHRVGRAHPRQLRPPRRGRHHPALQGRLPQEPPEPLVGRRATTSSRSPSPPARSSGPASPCPPPSPRS